MKPEQMQIKFDGQTHQIDANTLINVLIHYRNVIEEANREMSGGAKEVCVKVDALKEGSFIVKISIIENALKQLFSSSTIGYISDLCSVVGGVFKAYKAFKGKPAKEAEVKTVVNNTTINQYITKIYNNRGVRESISKSIETIREDASVESVTIGGDHESATFERAEFNGYIYNDFDNEVEQPAEKNEEVEATMTIIALNFEPGSRWQFIYEGFKIQMTVKDDALMKAIDEGARFGKGDAIQVKLRITKRYNPAYKAYENKSYKIVEFHKHIEAHRQQELF